LFLTKVIVPLYSGLMLQKFVPAVGVRHPEHMWLVFAIVAMISPIMLIVFKGWVGDLKTRSD